MITYLLAAIALASLITNIAMYYHNTGKVNKFESNCIATLKARVGTLEDNKNTQWLKIDKHKEDTDKKLDSLKEIVVRLDERVKISEILKALVNKAVNGKA